MKPLKSPDKTIPIDYMDCLFESSSVDVFNQVFTLTKANEMWIKLQELYNGSSNVMN
jgi:hypothetical protein